MKPQSSLRAHWRPLGLLGVAATFSAALLVASLADAAGDDDPQAEAVPVPEYVDDARSFIATVAFDAPTSGVGQGVTVAAVATPGTDHLPVGVIVREELAGTVLRSSTMPHPAISFADRHGFFFEPGSYDVLAPFDPDAETLRITDPAGVDVAVIDTTPAIAEYCAANPSHPNCLEADLAVLSLTASGPLFAVVGEPVTIGAGSTVTNLGPDIADVTVRQTVSGPAGVTISPTGERTSVLPGMDPAAEPASLSEGWTVTCQEGGVKPLTITTSVRPTRAKVVDAVADNNSRTTTLHVDCAVPVTINIQPGTTRNPVNLNGSVLPVAVLSTAAGEYGNPAAFTATQIDPLSLRFGSRQLLLGGSGVVETHGAIHPEDSLELDERRRDGDIDALVHFRPRQDAVQPSDTRGCVFGRTTPGSVAFFGCDAITVLR